MRPEHSKYAQMGMAALLPGMQYMAEQMQRMLDEFRAQLAALQDGTQPGIGRPPGSGGGNSIRQQVLAYLREHPGSTTEDVREALGLDLASKLPFSELFTQGLVTRTGTAKKYRYFIAAKAPRTRGWSDDPEERRREMKRRMAKRKTKRTSSVKMQEVA